jgi:hypothetical protein
VAGSPLFNVQATSQASSAPVNTGQSNMTHTAFIVWVVLLGIVLPGVILGGLKMGGFSFVFRGR